MHPAFNALAHTLKPLACIDAQILDMPKRRHGHKLNNAVFVVLCERFASKLWRAVYHHRAASANARPTNKVKAQIRIKFLANLGKTHKHRHKGRFFKLISSKIRL